MKRGRARLIKKLKQLLPPERFKHALRAGKTAKFIAKHYAADINKVEVAALLHDCSRFLKPSEMLGEAKKLGFKIDKTQKFEPKLLHAGLSAYYTRHLFGIKDLRILKAIRSHTVGNNNMSLLDKIVYLADHIEEHRDYKEIKKVRTLVYKNLNLAVIESLNSMIRHLLKLGMPVYEQTIRTRNKLIWQTI